VIITNLKKTLISYFTDNKSKTIYIKADKEIQYVIEKVNEAVKIWN
jgi:biopolymer transport protein ExbD